MPKFLSESNLHDIALSFAAKHSLIGDKQDLIEVMVRSCPHIIVNGQKHFAYDDVRGFTRNFIKWAEEEDVSMLRRHRGFKTDRIPDVMEVVESSQFMGMKGSVYPAVAEALWEIWHSKTHDYVEVVLTGPTGTGKSFILNMCNAYMLVLLSLLHDPQGEIGLAPGTPLYLVMQAGSYEQARNILFRPFYNALAVSPYFTKTFPYDKEVRSEMVFPNNIYVTPFSGSDDAVLGLTVVGGGITELNRMAYIRGSKRARQTADHVYDQATRIYNTLIRRMTSRTMQQGRLWGKLVLDAAHEHPDDFTSQKIKEAANSDQIFVYSKRQWDVLPPEKFSGKQFLVEMGTETRRTRVLNSREEAVDTERVIEVPVEYERMFRQDPDGSLRDFAGEVIGALTPAIPFREQIAAGVQNHEQLAGGQQLFTTGFAFINDYLVPGTTSDFSPLINMSYVERIFLNTGVVLAGHVDPAIKHDTAGVAIGHILGWTIQPSVKKYNPRTRKVTDSSEVRVPIVMIDGMLSLHSKRGNEIDLTMIQNLILYLTTILPLKFVGIDSYQSAQMVQAWSTHDIVTGPLSVDTTLEPYTRVRLAYRDSRLYTPNHEQYLREIMDLQMEKGKYDHLPGGSKDVSDAVAGTVYLLETHVADLSLDHVRGATRLPERNVVRGRRLGVRRRT
jgi:hypothetical protein